MAPQFQPPNIPGLQYHNTIPQSIDALFSAYQQERMQEQQMQLGQVQLAGAQSQLAGSQLDQRMQYGGMSAAEALPLMAQASQPQSMVPTQPTPLMGPSQAPQSLYMPQQTQQRPMAAPPQGAAPQFYQPQQEDPRSQMQPVAEDSKVGFLRQLMGMHMQGQQLGAMQQVAGLQKTQAEGAKAEAEASLAGAQVGLLNGSEGVVNHYVDQIKSGKMTLDDLGSLGRGDVANAIKVSVGNALAAQGVNTNALSNQQSKNKATATYEGGPDVQGKARTASSIISDANTLKALSTSLGKDSYQAINKLGLEVAAQRGDVKAQELLDQAKLVADRFQALVGGGSDAKLELGLSLFSAAKTPAQIERGIARMTESLQNYSSSLQGKPMTASGDAPKTSAGGMVSVVSPEGIPGTIPAAKLSIALKRGFKQR